MRLAGANEHRLLRVCASTYGIDISPENITEARGRMAHVLLGHYQQGANTVLPTTGLLDAAALILGANVVVGDSLNDAEGIELCDWQPRPGGCFQRVWSAALVPEAECHFFWMERVEDSEPVHYSALAQPARADVRLQAIRTRIARRPTRDSVLFSGRHSPCSARLGEEALQPEEDHGREGVRRIRGRLREYR